jgi:putative membrane protein
VIGILLRWILSAIALLVIAKIVPGIHAGFLSALFAAIVIGLVNAFLRPIFVILTLPLTILTLGLFLFVINALLFALAAWLVPGFTVVGFRAALVGSILYAIAGMIIRLVGKTPDTSREGTEARS